MIVVDVEAGRLTFAEALEIIEAEKEAHPDREVWMDGDRMQVVSCPIVPERVLQAAVDQPEASWRSLRNLAQYMMGSRIVGPHDLRLVAERLLAERASRGLETYVETRWRCLD